MRKRGLSRRQRECLEGRRRHMTAKQIGRELNISHNTVAMHCRLAKLKAGLDNCEAQSRGLARPHDLAGLTFGLHASGRADWSSRIATAVLILEGALSVIFLLAAASVAVAHALSLSFQKPFYNLFG
jgi:DNA-binding CsgD family transcriptional regulator